MNPNININRHRSPTQKAPPTVIKGYHFVTLNRQQKNDMHSSTQQSTKQDQPSMERQSISRQYEQYPSTNQAFFKVKKQQPVILKHETDLMKAKNYNSQKALNYKTDFRVQIKPKKSPQKFYDYFGFKNTLTIQNKQKQKHSQKHSDSRDSELRKNSGHSTNSEGKLKFLSNKIDKKFMQEQVFINQYSNTRQLEQTSKQLKGIKNIASNYKQMKPEFNKNLVIQRLNINSQNSLLHYTPRKQSPTSRTGLHQTKKQEEQFLGVENPNHKRSSLTPKKKLQPQVIQYNENISNRTNVTPKKYQPNTAHQKQMTPPKYVPTLQKPKIATATQGQFSNSSQSKDFSFSKQKPRKPSEQAVFFAKYNPRNLSMSIISIFPISHDSSYMVSFIILEKLVENRSSSVYKCLHPPSGAVYCLKKSLVDKNNIQQLTIQHKLSTYLSHSNLVRTFASFYDKNFLYLLMQYMQGRSLINRNPNNPFQLKSKQEKQQDSSKIGSDAKINRLSYRERPKFRETMYDQEHQSIQTHRYSNLHTFSNTFGLTPQKNTHLEKLNLIKSVLEQILQGLRFLHQNNIVHRDLKPDNIFVSHNCYKIGDFGSCTYTNSQDFVGTLDYAAPQIMMKQKYDRSIDLWSLGCIAFQLDVGRPPFYHYDRSQTIRRIINVEYDDELISDPSLKRFIGKLLLRNGYLRISANEALMEIKMMEFNSQPSNYGYGSPRLKFKNSEG